jgi:RNA polymerase sigma factor (sigma-70 family)
MTAQLVQTHSPLDQVRRRRARRNTSTSVSTLTPQQQAIIDEVLAGPVDYVEHPVFEQDDAECRVFEQAPEIPTPNTSWYHPVMEDLSTARQARSIVNIVLTAEQERALFVQFNYARFRTEQARAAVGSGPITEPQARELLYWQGRASELRDRIAQFNLALVLAMAKRVRSSDLDFADLISEGNMALLRAIDKFNVDRGFKFSTYACRAILKAFSRIGVKQTQYRNMFPTDFDPALERSDHSRRRFDSHEDDCAAEVRRIVEHNRAELTDVEQAVINHRFAITDKSATRDARPLTLEQVGKLVGLTKERVRQIQNKALEKIRHELEAHFLDGRRSEEAQPGEEE